jgi:hypothetical protein
MASSFAFYVAHCTKSTAVLGFHHETNLFYLWGKMFYNTPLSETAMGEREKGEKGIKKMKEKMLKPEL